MSLALDYSLQRIDRDIPSFHKELLTAWHRRKDYRERTGSAESVTDILKKPLFCSDKNPRTLARTTEELRELFVALPPQWSQKICTASI